MRLPKPLLRLKPSVQKYDFGHVLIIAGSANMLGAAALASLAAMRMGAGLVTAAIPRSLNLTLQKKLNPSIMTLSLPDRGSFNMISKYFNKFNAVAIGPGMGQSPQTIVFVRKMIQECPLPMVVDADALNILAKEPKILKKSKALRILTPHAGEMRRLVNLPLTRIQEAPEKIVKAFAQEYQCTCLLKGPYNIIAFGDGQLMQIKAGNAGMAKAGSGDILTGILAALIGQGIPFKEAIRLAVILHGKAGDLAAQKYTKTSMIATDIIEQIPEALKKINAIS